MVFFRDAQFIPIKRNELFGLTDFLANCGGLLGLFMGVSILSLVEIFYYCVIKPVIIWSKSEKEDPKVVQVKVADGTDRQNVW